MFRFRAAAHSFFDLFCVIAKEPCYKDLGAKSVLLRYVWVTVRKRGLWLLGSRVDAWALKHLATRVQKYSKMIQKAFCSLIKHSRRIKRPSLALKKIKRHLKDMYIATHRFR